MKMHEILAGMGDDTIELSEFEAKRFLTWLVMQSQTAKAIGGEDPVMGMGFERMPETLEELAQAYVDGGRKLYLRPFFLTKCSAQVWFTVFKRNGQPFYAVGMDDGWTRQNRAIVVGVLARHAMIA